MKKTVNINLAGTFFHIDEDAYAKLSRYLDAIRKSLTDPKGSDEIMRDIEARIAELFNEKIQSQSQVISIKELDEVIAVMGQPEDYMVDEEMFEDEPVKEQRARRQSGHKQLFRDIDNKFIAGVSSGLSHYLGIDAIWVRLLWILLTFLSSGFFIIIYILFWILVPAAVTTSDKLKMTGEPVNISNIERKFKEGYDSVADSVKNADYDKYGNKIKKGTAGFFETLGKVILAILTIFVKFLGVLLILTSLSVLIGLIISLFTLGTVGLWGTGEIMDYISLADISGAPIWLVSLVVFFAVGIPFFALFILGLKLLINNLKSLGRTVKISLVIVWVLSLIGLGILGIQQATQRAYEGEVISENTFAIDANDTVYLSMRADHRYEYEVYRQGNLQIEYDENDEKVIYSNDVRLIVKSTRDSVAKIRIMKEAEGEGRLAAEKYAEAINYSYSLENNTLYLDGFFTTDTKNKFRDQEVTVTVFLPEGSVLVADKNTRSFHSNYSNMGDILDYGKEGHYLRIIEGDVQCLDCPVETYNDDENEVDKNSYEDDVMNTSPDANTNVIDAEGNLHEGGSDPNWENEVYEDFQPSSAEIQEQTQDTINQNQ
ncbi:PspC domain-containing protein [Luteirhabdus pelagi]|uniref:PspC domain-containing protein n=1 Tax=Luteirhabdus pelagi TaxID=2792783 RepID=UPI00193A90A9|nr:PspC domain-containing protein [Luteirhabdus pelagi]